MRRGRKTYKTTQHNKQTKLLGGVVAQNNQVGHAPPQFDSSERGYAPGNENNKKNTQKREVKTKQAHRQRATKTKNL